MPGTRSLTALEERNLIVVARRLKPRNRLLVTIQLFTGYRICELLSLQIKDIWQNEAVVPRISMPLHKLEKHRKYARSVPVSRELARAIEHYMKLRLAGDSGGPDEPLFLSRTHHPDGSQKATDRRQALRVMRATLAKAGVEDDGRLGTHTLRKTFARKAFEGSRRNLIKVRDALGHASVFTTDEYVESLRADVEAAILKADWTVQR